MKVIDKIKQKCIDLEDLFLTVMKITYRMKDGTMRVKYDCKHQFTQQAEYKIQYFKLW